MKQMKPWMMAAILTLCGTATALAQTSYNYIERAWDSDNKVVTETIKTLNEGDYSAINGSDTEGWVGLNNGWYVVTGDSEYKVLNVVGDDVHLIIPDGVTLTLTGGVKLETGHKLTIYGQENDSGMLTATNSYSDGAAIGGGGSGLSCGELVIQGSTISATGANNGAGIGGGSGQGFYGQLTIYGGKVTAQGGENGAGIGSGKDCSEIAGFMYIYGGVVNATGGQFAAGIGGGYCGDGAVLNIHGGEVTGTAGRHSAGIGGGCYGNGIQTYIKGGTVVTNGTLGGGDGSLHSGKGNGGLIEISGGNVTARGRYTTSADDSTGAGIGCGNQGESATIVISGGQVWAYGGEQNGRICPAGIGGGGQNAPTLDITISGGRVVAEGYQGIGAGSNVSFGERDFEGTLSITGGTIFATGSKRAVGGANGVGFGLYAGAQVKAGATDGEAILFSADQRVPACLWRAYAAISPCVHSEATYTVSGTSATDTHTKHCNYCTTEFTAETHTFDSDGKCTVCGVSTSVSTVTIYVPKADTQTDGDYDTPMSYKMVTDETFNLPPAPNTPEGMEFVGWVTGDVSHTSFITNGSETLIAAESEYTITADVTLTARYRYIDVILNDVTDNSEVLIYYNGMKAHSVKLFGRTLYKDGAWNTLCLPFDVTLEGSPLEGATVKTLTSSSFEDGTLTLNFSDDLNAVEAGKPYLVKWASGSDIVNPVFSGVTVRNTTANVSTDYVDFVGTYSPEVYDDANRSVLFLGGGSTLYYPDGTAATTIGACRAYFKLADGITAGDPSTGVRAFVLNFCDGTTGINSLTPRSALPLCTFRSKNSSPKGEGSGYYTLDGRRLSGKPTTKGLYINNGIKVVIK